MKNLSEVIKDSKIEIEDLHANIEKQFDKNYNNNEILDTMKFKTRDSSQGRPYYSNIRQIYYLLQSHEVGVEHIGPIFKYIFDTFNTEYSVLPSCSPALLLDKKFSQKTKCRKFLMKMTILRCTGMPQLHVEDMFKLLNYQMQKVHIRLVCKNLLMVVLKSMLNQQIIRFII